MTNAPTSDKLIVAVDLPGGDEARRLIDELGDSVGFYKLGLEMLFNGGLDMARGLRGDGKKVFLDLKFLDIGNTVERAVRGAVDGGYCDILNFHAQDSQTVKAARAGSAHSGVKVIGVTVLTTLDQEAIYEQGFSSTRPELVIKRAAMAKRGGVDGVVASAREARAIRQLAGPDFLIVTPGIRRAEDAADDQKNIVTPHDAIVAGASHLVVGRPIVAAKDRRGAAERFLEDIARAEEQLAAEGR